MKKEEIRNDQDDKIIQYIMGELNAYDRTKLEMEIRMDDELQYKFDHYSEVYGKAKELPKLKPSESQKVRFNDWLENEVEQEKSHSTSIKKEGRIIHLNSWLKYGIAASIALLIGVFGANMYQDILKQEEQVISKNETKDDYYKMINSNSTMGKIKEINNSTKKENLDPEIRDALIEVMQNDPSPNVRLTVVEGLSLYNQDEVIKSSLIAALSKENTPIVQMAMINALVNLNQPDTKIHLQELIDKDGVDPFVKDEARLGIISI